ncbi:MAG: deoxynucleoside kinase [Fidelibacterota bacterium]
MTGPAYYIAIEGVIGVGKTSLARIISRQLNSRLILEKFEENPFLSDFYQDRQRYAFQTQLFFLLSRYRQQMELMQTDIFHRSLITDYVFAKDRLFAYINLEEKELHLYDQLYSILSREITKPDLVIYLQAETDRLMKNIDLRGRKYEQNMDRNYIDSLNQFYNQYFFHYNETPLLIINTTSIDFVNKKEDLEEVMKYIQQPPVGTKYYKAGNK